MCIRTKDDVKRLKEVLFGYKRYFQCANNLKNSSIELIDISEISKIQILLHFKLSGENLDDAGFQIQFEANYANSIEAIVTDVSSKISDYTDNLSAVFDNLQTFTPSNIKWRLCGDGKLYFILCCKAGLSTSCSRYAVQFEQSSVTDVRSMTDLCSKCIEGCLRL